jgi:hypothetical protein
MVMQFIFFHPSPSGHPSPLSATKSPEELEICFDRGIDFFCERECFRFLLPTAGEFRQEFADRGRDRTDGEVDKRLALE